MMYRLWGGPHEPGVQRTTLGHVSLPNGGPRSGVTDRSDFRRVLLSSGLPCVAHRPSTDFWEIDGDPVTPRPRCIVIASTMRPADAVPSPGL